MLRVVAAKKAGQNFSMGKVLIYSRSGLSLRARMGAMCQQIG